MVVKEDELELGLLHEEHLRVERGVAGSGRKKELFYTGKSLVPVCNTNRTKGLIFSPGWCYQPGLMSLAMAGLRPRAFSPDS
jgi:hypothetical protein